MKLLKRFVAEAEVATTGKGQPRLAPGKLHTSPNRLRAFLNSPPAVRAVAARLRHDHSFPVTPADVDDAVNSILEGGAAERQEDEEEEDDE